MGSLHSSLVLPSGPAQRVQRPAAAAGRRPTDASTAHLPPRWDSSCWSGLRCTAKCTAKCSPSTPTDQVAVKLGDSAVLDAQAVVRARTVDIDEVRGKKLCVELGDDRTGVRIWGSLPGHQSEETTGTT